MELSRRYKGFYRCLDEGGRPDAFELQDSDVVCFRSVRPPMPTATTRSFAREATESRRVAHVRAATRRAATVTLEKVEQPGEWKLLVTWGELRQFEGALHVRRRLLAVRVAWNEKRWWNEKWWVGVG